MKIETIIIALMLCSITFLGLFGLMSDAGIYNNIDVDSQLQVYSAQNNNTAILNVFNKINETKQQEEIITSNYTNLEQDPINSLVGFGKTVKMVGDSILMSVTNVKTIFQVLTNILDIPPEVSTAFTIILIITMVLSLLYLLLGVVRD